MYIEMRMNRIRKERELLKRCGVEGYDRYCKTEEAWLKSYLPKPRPKRHYNHTPKLQPMTQAEKWFIGIAGTFTAIVCLAVLLGL